MSEHDHGTNPNLNGSILDRFRYIIKHLSDICTHESWRLWSCMKQRSHVPSSTVLLKVSSQFLCSGKDFVTVFFRHYFITIVSGVSSF